MANWIGPLFARGVWRNESKAKWAKLYWIRRPDNISKTARYSGIILNVFIRIIKLNSGNVNTEGLLPVQVILKN